MHFELFQKKNFRFSLNILITFAKCGIGRGLALYELGYMYSKENKIPSFLNFMLV